ncbi:MAG: hypothetical protein JWR23_981 [Mucilaginibacter sp.]|nr:hypothetical protein [Mucilaginibacter sp.]
MLYVIPVLKVGEWLAHKTLPAPSRWEGIAQGFSFILITQAMNG